MIDSDTAEEDEMFSLAVEFSTRMPKRYVTLDGEAISSSGEKRPKWSPSGKGDQKDWAIVSVKSSDLASDDSRP